tara:strand:- start:229 stop:582 length:354 start_codon:yes stop_codon:yes gene_type:complete
MTLGTKIYTWLNGFFVGEDEFGNRYYANASDFMNHKVKRWVIYNGEIEASKVPPHWHAWLHKSVDEAPTNYKPKYDWQKSHKNNMTGTNEAYYPSNHPLSKDFKLNEEQEDYESWSP